MHSPLQDRDQLITITISILPFFSQNTGQTYRYLVKSLSLTTDNDEQLRSPLVTFGYCWLVVPNSLKLIRSYVCVCVCVCVCAMCQVCHDSNIQHDFLKNFENSLKFYWSSEPVDRQLVEKSSQIHWFCLDFYLFFSVEWVLLKRMAYWLMSWLRGIVDCKWKYWKKVKKGLFIIIIIIALKLCKIMYSCFFSGCCQYMYSLYLECIFSTA